MKLNEFAASLRPQDASVAVALAELVRRADDDGVLERGEWLAALSNAWTRLLGGGAGNGESAMSGADPEQLAQYLDDHILARLTAEGIARGEPEGDAWERARIDPSVWADLRENREAVAAGLDVAAQSLIDTGE